MWQSGIKISVIGETPLKSAYVRGCEFEREVGDKITFQLALTAVFFLIRA